MVETEQGHLDWNTMHIWDGSKRRWRTTTANERQHLYCIPQTVIYIGTGNYVWLCEEHYQQAIKEGYIW